MGNNTPIDATTVATTLTDKVEEAMHHNKKEETPLVERVENAMRPKMIEIKDVVVEATARAKTIGDLGVQKLGQISDQVKGKINDAGGIPGITATALDKSVVVVSKIETGLSNLAKTLRYQAEKAKEMAKVSRKYDEEHKND